MNGRICITSVLSAFFIVLIVFSNLKAEPDYLERYLNQYIKTSQSIYAFKDITNANPYKFDYEIDSSLVIRIQAIDTASGEYWFAIALYTQEGENLNTRYRYLYSENGIRYLGWVKVSELLDHSPIMHHFDERYGLQEYQRIELWIKKRRFDIRTVVVADWLFPISPASSFEFDEEFELIDSMTFYIDYKPKHPDTQCFTGSHQTVSIPKGSWIKFGIRPDVRFPFCYRAAVFLKPSPFRDSLESSWGWRSKSGLGGYIDGRQLSSFYGEIDTTAIMKLKSRFIDEEHRELEQLYQKYGITRIVMDSIELESQMKHWKDDDNVGFTDSRLPRNTLYYNELRPPNIAIDKLPK